MDEFRKDIQLIRESQIRMEGDLEYHIHRTDLLEDKLKPIEKVYIFGKYLLMTIALVVSLAVGIKKATASSLDKESLVSILTANTGCELVVTSSYRSPIHNLVIGGSKTSLHMKDRAIDITPINKNCLSVQELGEVASTLGYYVIIYKRHVHIDNRYWHQKSQKVSFFDIN